MSSKMGVGNLLCPMKIKALLSLVWKRRIQFFVDYVFIRHFSPNLIKASHQNCGPDCIESYNQLP